MYNIIHAMKGENEKMDRKDIAMILRDKRYNCCQAVICAFSDDPDVDADVMFRAAEGFGGGMGCGEGPCGALVGAVMLAGLKNSDGDTEEPKTKETTSRLAREIYKRFNEETGAVKCRDLKGTATGKPIRSCADCVTMGVEIAEEVLGL